MTIQELKDWVIKEIGEKYISECDGRFYISFDKNDALDFLVLPNFTLEELLTKNTVDTYTKIELGVLVLLQDIRDDFGHSVVVSSSYRSEGYNKSRDGKTASRHLISDALDSHPKDKKRLPAYKKLIIKKDIPGGMGLYPGFVHIDTRPWKARW